MAGYYKTVKVFGSSYPNVNVGTDEDADVMRLSLEGGGHTLLYVCESKNLRKALKKAERRASRNGGDVY